MELWAEWFEAKSIFVDKGTFFLNFVIFFDTKLSIIKYFGTIIPKRNRVVSKHRESIASNRFANFLNTFIPA